MRPDQAEHVILHELGHASAATDSVRWTRNGGLASRHSPTVSCGDIRALQAR